MAQPGRRSPWRVSAGLVDAALASLATFACGLYAGKHLELAELGAYAIVFAAFVVASLIPHHLLFTPFEIEVVRLPEGSRLAVLRASMGFGLPIALASAICLLPVVWTVPPSVPGDTVTALVTTAIAAAVLSPCQDHLRRMLHLDRRSWHAAGVSSVHCAIILAGLFSSGAIGLPPSWVPFGCLAAGNAFSLCAGLVFALRVSAQRPRPSYRVHDLMTAGMWLVLVGLLPNGAALVSVVMVAHLAGSTAAGFAEAARLVAQPVFVFSVGLAAVFGPQSTAAAQRRAPRDAQRLSWEFRAWLLGTGAIYAVWVATAWSGNPFATLLPNAYAISWLVLGSLVANILNAVALPQRAELLGAGQARTLAAVEALGSLGRAGLAATAGATAAFAIPAGLAWLGVCRWYCYPKALRRHYRTAPAPKAQAPAVS